MPSLSLPTPSAYVLTAALALTGCPAQPPAALPPPEVPVPAAARAPGPPTTTPSGVPLPGIPVLPVAGVATYGGAPVAGALVAAFRLGQPALVGTARTAADGSFVLQVEGVKAGVPLELVTYQAGHVLATVAFARPAARLPATRGLYELSQLSQTTTIATGVLSNALHHLGALAAVRDPERLVASLKAACLSYDGYVARHGGASTMPTNATLLALGTPGTAPARLLGARPGGAIAAWPSFVETLHVVVQDLRTKAGSTTGLAAGYRLAAVTGSAATARLAYASFAGLYAGSHPTRLAGLGEPMAATDLPAYAPGFVQGLFDPGAAAPDTVQVGSALRYYFGESEGDAASLEQTAMLVQRSAPEDGDPDHVQPATLSNYAPPVPAAAGPGVSAAAAPGVTAARAAEPTASRGAGGGSGRTRWDVDATGDVGASDGSLVTAGSEALAPPPTPR